MTQYKISVIGIGVVGQALVDTFLKAGHQVYTFDKNKNKGEIFDISEVQSSGFVFLCLPTPTKDGKQDISAIKSVLNKFPKSMPDTMVVLKSTVLPGTTEELSNKFNIPIIHNPEFISEKTALDDSINQTNHFFGISDNIGWDNDYKQKITAFLHSTYPNVRRYVNKSVYFLRSQETEMIKYTANCFYATKIVFCNEIYRTCKNFKANYNNVIKGAINSRGWITANHTNVPGRHGFGYSGMCFPKDMKAFSTYSDLIKKVDELNEMMKKINEEE